jgi:hypothetical protein
MNTLKIEQSRKIAKLGCYLFSHSEFEMLKNYLDEHKMNLADFVEVCENGLVEGPSVDDLLRFVGYEVNQSSDEIKTFWSKKIVADYVEIFELSDETIFLIPDQNIEVEKIDELIEAVKDATQKQTAPKLSRLRKFYEDRFLNNKGGAV